MKYSEFLLGNTSSGIIEAAAFGKYVVNVGNRQKGRARSENVIDCDFETNNILRAVSKVNDLGNYSGTNIYRKPNTATSIIEKLKRHYAPL